MADLATDNMLMCNVRPRSVLGLSAYRPPDMICLAAIPTLISVDSIKSIHNFIPNNFCFKHGRLILQRANQATRMGSELDDLIVGVNKLNVMTGGDTFMPSNSGHVP